MHKRLETYDERCSRIDEELRATETRWPKGKAHAAQAALAILLWVFTALVIWAGYEVWTRIECCGM